VEAASIPRRSRARLGGLLDAEGPGPTIALIGGSALIAFVAALVAAHVTVFALDESLIQQSALHYSSNLPHSLLHDLDARATNRLYSLVLSIAYRITGGPAAVRIDHVLSALMFVSAAFPVYLIARRLLGGRWSAVAVALLSVTAPWLALTSALFTENLSYPIFWWVMLAICSAIASPSPRRDLVTLVAIGLLISTRVQFAAVFVGYLLCLLAISCWRAWPGAEDNAGRLRRLARVAGRGFPFTIALFVLVVIVLVVARVSGQWHAHVEHLLGSYSNVVIRNGLPSNMTEGVLIEVIALALGIGLLPAVVAFPWYLGQLSRPSLERRWVELAVCGAVLAVFMLLTVYSQGGYLGEITEERYFFYVIPVLWIGGFAAVREAQLRGRDILLSATVLAVLFGSIPFLSPLTEETAFLAPVESVVPHILIQRINGLGIKGLSVQDALVAITLLLGVVTALVWRRWPARRALWTLGVAALVQLLTAGYAFAVIVGRVQGIQGRTSGGTAGLGWVDAHAGGETVTWLEDLSTVQPPAIGVAAAGLAADQTHVTLFWNSQIRNTATVPAIDPNPVEFPLSALNAQGSFTVSPRDGALQPAAPAAGMREVVGQAGSPFLQLAGTTLARSPDGFLALTRLRPPVRASWTATGLQPDGFLTAGVPVRARAFAPLGENALRVTLTFVPPPPPAGAPTSTVALGIRFGDATRELSMRAGSSPRTVSLTSCLPRGARVLSGNLEPHRSLPLGERQVSALLASVSVTAAPGASCAPDAH
jgi:hypothetical protein